MKYSAGAQVLLAVLLGSGLVPCPAVGQEDTALQEEIAKICKANPSLCKERGRLSAYQPNYAIWENSEDDEESLEVHYSFRYLLYNQECKMADYIAGKVSAQETLECLKKYEKRWEVYLTYTGEFDFYFQTRDSGPVINRISNPAVQVRKYCDNGNLVPGVTLAWLNVAAEHRSDGQVVEIDERVTDPSSAYYGKYKTQAAYEQGDHEYFDSLSRGANYISLEGKFEVGGYYDKSTLDCKGTGKCFELWISYKPFYITEDSAVNWGPLAGKGVDISDYDRVKVVLSNTFPTGLSWLTEPEVSGAWTVGDEGADTDSFDIDIFLPIDFEGWWRLPLYMRYHHGPMASLSNYTQEQDSFGIGIKLR